MVAWFHVLVAGTIVSVERRGAPREFVRWKRFPVIAVMTGYPPYRGLDRVGVTDMTIAEAHVTIGRPKTGVAMIDSRSRPAGLVPVPAGAWRDSQRCSPRSVIHLLARKCPHDNPTSHAGLHDGRQQRIPGLPDTPERHADLRTLGAKQL